MFVQVLRWQCNHSMIYSIGIAWLLMGVQCAPGANFKPVLELLDKVLIARKQIEAAQAAAAGKLGTAAAGGKPGQQQQRGTAATAAAAKGQKPDGQQQQKVSRVGPSAG
jgi:hypothetical protein